MIFVVQSSKFCTLSFFSVSLSFSIFLTSLPLSMPQALFVAPPPPPPPPPPVFLSISLVSVSLTIVEFLSCLSPLHFIYLSLYNYLLCSNLLSVCVPLPFSSLILPLSVSLSTSTTVCSSHHISTHPLYLSLSLSVCLSVCLSNYLFIYQSSSHLLGISVPLSFSVSFSLVSFGLPHTLSFSLSGAFWSTPHPLFLSVWCLLVYPISSLSCYSSLCSLLLFCLSPFSLLPYLLLGTSLPLFLSISPFLPHLLVFLSLIARRSLSLFIVKSQIFSFRGSTITNHIPVSKSIKLNANDRTHLSTVKLWGEKGGGGGGRGVSFFGLAFCSEVT